MAWTEPQLARMRRFASKKLEELEGVGYRPSWADKPALKAIWNNLDDDLVGGWNTVHKTAMVVVINATQAGTTANEKRVLMEAFLEAVIERGS